MEVQQSIVKVFLFVLWTMGHHKVCGDPETDDEISELLAWDPPKELKEAYPYYFLGHDYSGDPVWLIEFGKWDLRWLSDGEGKKFRPFMPKYAKQALRRFYYSVKNTTAATTNTQSGEYESGKTKSRGFLWLHNADGFSMSKVLHPDSVRLMYQSFEYLWDVEQQESPHGLKHCLCFNINFAGALIWNLLYRNLGSSAFIDKFHIVGREPEKYRQEILLRVPADILPVQYGGTRDMNSIPVFG